MAVYQKESGTCHGRGFSGSDATGFLAKFYTWVTKAGGSGGPGWTILLDKSTAPVLTTFTVPDHTNDKCYGIAHGMYTGDILQVSNSGGALPGNLSASTDYYVIKVDADNFKLATTWANAQVGTAVNISSAGSGTNSYQEIGPYIVVSDQSTLTINQSAMILKIGMRSTEAGFVRVQYFLSFDTTNKILYGLWSGYRIPTYDDADFAYDFRGGAEVMILQSRLGTTWSTTLIDTFTGDAIILEGADKTGTVAAPGVSAGSSVVIPLGAGEEENFTVNNYYYIYDFNGHSFVNYCKVTAVDTGAHTITVDTLSNAFPAGSVIAAYAHRFYAMGSDITLAITDFTYTSSSGKCQMPYCSAAAGYVFHNQTSYIYGAFSLSKEDKYLLSMAPNDNGVYAVQRPGLTELYRKSNPDGGSTTLGMNRGYGVCKNVYITALGVMAKGQDGRTISAKNWLYFQAESELVFSGSASLALLFLDTVSAS